MRRVARALSGLLLILFLCPGLTRPAPAVEYPQVHATPLPRERVEAVSLPPGWRLAGGLILTSAHRRFGGLSALAVLDAAAPRYLALSDRGSWVTFTLRLGPWQRPEGVRDVRAWSLRALSGRSVYRRRPGDAESLVRWRNGWLVSFENEHRLLWYNDRFEARERLDPPKALAQAPGNGGLEAITALPDGRLLLLTEEMDVPGGVRGWLGTPGAWREVTWQARAPWRPVGAATLPNGDVVVLERRFALLTGFRTRLMRLPRARWEAAGTTLRPHKLFDLPPGLPAQNYEGLTVEALADGGLALTVIADDNFHSLLETVLLRFLWRPEHPS